MSAVTAFQQPAMLDGGTTEPLTMVVVAALQQASMLYGGAAQVPPMAVVAAQHQPAMSHVAAPVLGLGFMDSGGLYKDPLHKVLSSHFH